MREDKADRGNVPKLCGIRIKTTKIQFPVKICEWTLISEMIILVTFGGLQKYNDE